jgi:uncharacterized repeat protein (TIGR03833 family)
MADTEKKQELEVGMTVEISPRSDRSGKQRVQGAISEILTKADYHPHGRLVNLESGETGRVKKILSGGKPAANALAPSAVPETASLVDLVAAGENHRVELKDRALWSVKYTNEDIKKHRPQTKELHAYGQATSKVIVAKTLASFLNSNGGSLIIGVKENKDGGGNQIVGVEPEYQTLKDGCQDGYRRMLVDLIKDYFPTNIFNHMDSYFQITFEKVEDQTVCGITISPSDKRVFLKLKGKDHFFIRTDASTRELTGEEVVDYCHTRFS